jgi:hypothetical protein
MEHFVGYHNFEEWGPYYRDASTNGERELSHFTAKSFLPETLIGNRVWIIEGSGSPRQYQIAASGIITSIEAAKRPREFRQPDRQTGIDVVFEADYLPTQSSDVTTLTWFRRLLESQQNFRRGFNRIQDERIIAELEEFRIAADGANADLGVALDVDLINKDKSVDSTTRKMLIDARLGQGRFRRELEGRWKNRCAVTGCEVSAILRASHIKPWRTSSNKERLNPGNGLLLVAHLDALFDCGLVSFGADGRMLLSKHFPSREARYFNLPAALRERPNAVERRFLEYHRESVFRRK